MRGYMLEFSWCFAHLTIAVNHRGPSLMPYWENCWFPKEKNQQQQKLKLSFRSTNPPDSDASPDYNPNNVSSESGGKSDWRSGYSNSKSVCQFKVENLILFFWNRIHKESTDRDCCCCPEWNQFAWKGERQVCLLFSGMLLMACCWFDSAQQWFEGTETCVYILDPNERSPRKHSFLFFSVPSIFIHYY